MLQKNKKVQEIIVSRANRTQLFIIERMFTPEALQFDKRARAQSGSSSSSRPSTLIGYWLYLFYHFSTNQRQPFTPLTFITLYSIFLLAVNRLFFSDWTVEMSVIFFTSGGGSFFSPLYETDRRAAGKRTLC